MKLNNLSADKLDKFFEIVDSCEGKVELVTIEGDRLNLKSKLCQYVALAKVFSSDMIDQLELVVYKPEDTDKFVNFMING